MSAVHARASGKLILSGEHAVVYGHPALAVAITRGTTVHLHTRPGPSGLDSACPSDPRLARALAAVLPTEGIGVRIDSDLPIGRGLGSSAALAVALVRALACLEGRTADFDECYQRGFEVERIFHGTPSGLDHTISAQGGAVCYRRGPKGHEITPVALPPLRLVVLDTEAAGNTAALVGAVRDRYAELRPVLDDIGALTQTLVEGIARLPPAELGELLTTNHRLLARIGVSTPALDHLVALALEHGALGAKLSGAGGGGVVLALVDDPNPLLRAASAAAVPAFSVGIEKRLE